MFAFRQTSSSPTPPVLVLIRDEAHENWIHTDGRHVVERESRSLIVGVATQQHTQPSRPNAHHLSPGESGWWRRRRRGSQGETNGAQIGPLTRGNLKNLDDSRAGNRAPFVKFCLRAIGPHKTGAPQERDDATASIRAWAACTGDGGRSSRPSSLISFAWIDKNQFEYGNLCTISALCLFATSDDVKENIFRRRCRLDLEEELQM